MPKEGEYKEFGDCIRRLRKRRGLTGRQLAKAIGVSPKGLETLIEAGHVEPEREGLADKLLAVFESEDEREELGRFIPVKPEKPEKKPNPPKTMKERLMHAWEEDEAENRKMKEQVWERIGSLYDALLAGYPGAQTAERNREIAKNLNILITRLVLLFYLSDSILPDGHREIYETLKGFGDDPAAFREQLELIFRILGAGDPRMLPFTHLFSPDFSGELPKFDRNITGMILKELSGDFSWGSLSPELFGSIFESTLTPEARHQGGMHYTSIENVHRVIDPLFLESLTDELMEITGMKEGRKEALEKYIRKLSELKFLDPACGSGNFLTESYISLRRLENEAIKEMRR